MIAVWRKYWPDVVGTMHHEKAMQFLENHYADNADAFAEAGFFYNTSTQSGLVILNNAQDVIIGGTAEVYSFGISQYTAMCNATVYAYDKSVVEVRDSVVATIYNNTLATAYDKTRIKATDHARLSVYSHRCRVVADADSSVDAISWLHIQAIGKAHIYAHSQRNIDLDSTATLTIKS